MPRILNYKSYYEAFKLGVVDDGFTPVARLLFFPLFDPKGSIVLCDENDVPYEANNKNSSAWGNGTEPIPQKIQPSQKTLKKHRGIKPHTKKQPVLLYV